MLERKAPAARGYGHKNGRLRFLPSAICRKCASKNQIFPTYVPFDMG